MALTRGLSLPAFVQAFGPMNSSSSATLSARAIEIVRLRLRVL
jgi:hypothetical protein